MSIIVSCQCGQQFATQERHVGKRVSCPMCGRPLTIGNPPLPPPATPPPAKTITIRAVCACGRSFLAPAAMQGMTMTCPGCHDMVVVPPADMPGAADLTAAADPLAGPLTLPVANDDSTEKLAFKVAYIAAGSVGLLALAIILTSLFQSIARVWSSPPTIAEPPPPAAAPAAPEAGAKKSFPSLPSFLPEDYSPFGRSPPAKVAKAPPGSPPAPAPPLPPPDAASASGTARANISGAGGDAATGNVPFNDHQSSNSERPENSTSRLAGATHEWHAQAGSPLRGLRRATQTDPPVAGISWLAELLPFLGQGPLYEKLNFSQTVTSRGNMQVGTVLVPEFVNPLDERQRWKGYPFEGLALTHFAGMSGVEDARNVVAAKLPRSDPRAGVFGYDAVARPNEITDGTSQTIMVAGSGALASPWIIGGGGTVRGAREPIFDKTSGLGTSGLSSGGAVVIMADGSVRQVSAQVDPKVFKAMCTTHGADSVDIKAATTPIGTTE